MVNKLEQECIDILHSLEYYGCTGLKVSFEDEGVDFFEIVKVKEYCNRLNLSLFVKIGGPEAIRDIKDCVKLGVNGIVAPMVETPFALSKFTDAIDKHYAIHGLIPHSSINVETITSINNLDGIIEKAMGKLYGITIGRGDLICSMNCNRTSSFADSPETFELIKSALTKIKKSGLKTNMGGCISKNSKDFIANLNKENLLDKFETRNVIFNTNCAILNFEKAISLAFEFECKYLTNKRNYYTILANQDISRIESKSK